MRVLEVLAEHALFAAYGGVGGRPVFESRSHNRANDHLILALAYSSDISFLYTEWHIRHGGDIYNHAADPIAIGALRLYR